MPDIPIPGIKSNVGLGDTIAKVANKIKKTPCEPCKKTQAKLNAVRLKPLGIPVPPGYTLREQGFLAGGRQVLLVQGESDWGTLFAVNGQGIAFRPADEATARADFRRRMGQTGGR